MGGGRDKEVLIFLLPVYVPCFPDFHPFIRPLSFYAFFIAKFHIMLKNFTPFLLVPSSWESHFLPSYLLPSKEILPPLLPGTLPPPLTHTHTMVWYLKTLKRFTPVGGGGGMNNKNPLLISLSKHLENYKSQLLSLKNWPFPLPTEIPNLVPLY